MRSMSASAVVRNRARRGLGFSTPEAVEAAASLLFPVVADRSRYQAQAILGGERVSSVIVSPGAIQVRTGLTSGWELTDRDEYTRGIGYVPQLFVTDRPAPTAPGLKAAVEDWSPKSRAMMTRRLATLDWSALVSGEGDTRPGLVTLTYPGDWEAVAPDGRTVKRHLDAFRRAWARDIGPVRGAWKLEYQRRGAPHFHLFMPCPTGMVDIRTGRGRGSSSGSVPFPLWVSVTWARIVGATGAERERHLSAGTGVDYGEGDRCSDPQRLAVYFSKHNAPGRSSKAYQHLIPDSWREPGKGPGRYWGVWGLKPCEATTEVDRVTAVDTVRLLRSWTEAQQRTQRISAPRHRRTIDRTTGEIVTRKSGRAVTRRWRVRSLYAASPGGFVLANNAPNLLAQMTRALSAPPTYGRGERRPLP